MLDFTEQALSTESLPKLSADTPTVSANHPVIKVAPNSLGDAADSDFDRYADRETLAKTEAVLAPYRDQAEFYQDEEDTEEV